MRLWLSAALMLLGSAVMACDVCSMYMSIAPYDYKHQLGLTYRTRMFEGVYRIPTVPESSPSRRGRMGGQKHLGHLSVPIESDVKELFNTLELRGRFYLYSRVTLDVVVPLSNNYRSVDYFTSKDVYGIGDPSLLVGYQIFATRSNGEDDALMARLQVGAGMKAPLGQKQKHYQGELADLDLQPGSGSWDVLAFLRFRARKGKWILGLIGAGRRNGEYKNLAYRYGSGGTATAEFMRAFKPGKWFIAPKVGWYSEFTGRDEERGTTVDASGGVVHFAQGGIELMKGSVALFGVYQQPVQQQLNGLQLSNTNRIIVGLQYNIKASN